MIGHTMPRRKSCYAKLAVFCAELKRSRVFRAAFLQGGMAFVIIQIIDGTLER